MAVSILRFPRGVIVPLFVESKVTDGFKNKIRKSFKGYTEGTNSKYLMEDKLSYIDSIRELNFPVSGEDIIKDALFQEFVENEDPNEILPFEPDEIEGMIDEGVRRARTEWSVYDGDEKLGKAAIPFIYAAIEEVMKYGEEQ